MIYSPKDVKKILAELKEGLQRYRPSMGGCGDPDCCGSYPEMEHDDKYGDYVYFYDLENRIKGIEENL